MHLTALQALQNWANTSSAEVDLEKLFGPALDWPCAFKHLDAFRRADISLLPPIHILPASDMPGLWGGYSRETRAIYLSSDCPSDNLSAVLIEEIGHFLDQELCVEETPGEEGARFAAAVLGLPLDAASQDDSLAPVFVQGRQLLVEAALKIRGSGKSQGSKFGTGKRKKGRKSSKKNQFGSGGDSGGNQGSSNSVGDSSSNPKLWPGIRYATQESARVSQQVAGDRLIGSRGNDTFAVISQDVKIEDPTGGTDTVESSVTFSLVSHSTIENLALTGSDNTSATGNLLANFISGNSANNLLDGGIDSSKDTLVGGAGNDSYLLRDALDHIVELPGGGNDTVLADTTTFDLSPYANVEGLAYAGTLSVGTSLTGNSSDNLISGSAGPDSLTGGAGIDTMIGGAGNDSYGVDRDDDLVLEAVGQGRDTVLSTAPHYALDGNVEILRLTGSDSIRGSGNELNNSLYGNNNDNTLNGLDGDDLIVGDGQLPGIDLTGRKVSAAGRSYLLESTNALVNGLGSPEFIINAGTFGERTVARTDDGSSSRIDLTSIFGSDGLNLYGKSIRSLFVNTNGNITFDAPFSSFSPDEISAGLIPIIAPFWADADTRGGRTTASSSGNSTGSNLVYYDVDEEARVLTVTWDDVGYWPNKIDKVNAFQLQLIDSGDGNAFVIFRYENIDWTTGGASGGVDGLGGQAARAGFNSGTGTLLELPQSGDDQSMLALDQSIPRLGLDSDRAGVFIFEIRSGIFIDNFGGNDWLFGGRGNDTLLGNGGNDTLLGEAGDDRLDGGLGADSMVGGTGNDSYVVDNAEDKVLENPGEGTDTVEAVTSYTLQGGSSIEVLRLMGVGNTKGTGNELDNTLVGNVGNNILRGQAGKDFLDGGTGQDTLFGDSGNDTLQGGVGDNAVDSLLGGDGDDVYLVDSVEDVIFDSFGLADRVISTVGYSLASTLVSGVENLELAGSGDINATGNSLANILIGNSGNNSLDGGGGSDTLFGGDGDDTLNGGKADAAQDSLVGGKGDDFYILDSELDAIDDEEGIDTVLATFSVNLSSTLVSGIENIILSDDLAVADLNINATGNSLANMIIGNSGANSLDGRGGADLLEGRGGNDILNGGTGDNAIDTLNGGEGNDIYIVDVANLDFPLKPAGVDFILDSGGNDTVQATSSYDLAMANISGPPIKTLFYTGTAPSTLRGNTADNLLRSQSAGDDVLEGRGGNDTLDGGLGANKLHGGDGDDYYIVNSNRDQVFENNDPLSGIDTILAKTATFALGLDSNVEILAYDPDGIAKTNLSGSDSDNTITGGQFGNVLSGFGGDDLLIGGVQSDALDGGAGNDTLDGQGGVDVLIGGAGDDYYIAYSQTVDIRENENEGKDTVRSTVNFSLTYSDKLAHVEGLYLVGTENLNGIGNTRDNTITGNDGNNSLAGRAGDDTILGGLGADRIFGDEGNDFLVGGGNPQGDIPADASTPIVLASGQTYTGEINSRNETDWIKVELVAGITYTFTIDSQLFGGSILSKRSDVAFGAQGSDAYWGWQDGVPGYAQPPLIGDATRTDSFVNGQAWVGNLTDHDELVLNADTSVAYGFVDPASLKKSSKFANNIIQFQFTPFDSGTFFIPVSSAGPALGAFRVTLTDPDNMGSGVPALADNASNTIVGGIGKDTLVAGNGRDTLGNAIGDILLGGTNGLLGQVDTDTEGDTLIGGDGNDSLDGGNGANSLVGGKGDDFYFVRSAEDKIVEAINGGANDAMILNFAAKLGGEWDVILDPDKTIPGKFFRATNVENVTLTGSADTSILGSPNSDLIVGNFGNNTFDGGVGDDTLLGEGGNDSLVGGDGADSLDGGSGTNIMDGGKGADTYVVNDRNDRIINENLYDSLAGGQDLIRTYFNFDPIQGSALEQFQPNQPDNSPSVTKSASFASRDLESFYNLEHFELLGGAVYGVGNARANTLTAGPASSLLLGMGNEDTLLGGAGDDSLYGDTPHFYASPDLYAAAPFDTQTEAFRLGVIGSAAKDYLDGGAGNDYLDGGLGFDTMIGGEGNDTFVQDNLDDYIVATGGGVNELISSVNVAKAPDGISKLMLVVANQDSSSGQSEVASFASFLGTQGGNNRTDGRSVGGSSFVIENANVLELIYSPREGVEFEEGGPNNLVVGGLFDDLDNPGNKQVNLSWSAAPFADSFVAGYTVLYKSKDIANDIWHTYVDGKSQDFQGTRTNPALVVKNLAPGNYEFKVIAQEIAIPALKDRSAAQHVTLQGGSGSDVVIGTRYSKALPDGHTSDALTDPLVWNNPINPLPLGMIFNPAPYNTSLGDRFEFATYLDGGYGNDFLDGAFLNDRSGDDYVVQGVTFKGLNTLVGGQGSDTFVVNNGGKAIGAEFDWIVKYGNETPVVTEAGNIGSFLNGGQHNLVVSLVDYLTLSDTDVHQGKFIDQLNLASSVQFGMGNRLDNYIYETSPSTAPQSTLVGNTGRDSIVGNSRNNLLIGGTAYGADNVGLAIRDFADVIDGGNGLVTSIFRDTDPIPTSPNGPGVADPSQFWFVPGYYGEVYDPNRNRDTLVANDASTLDGGAGRDSLVGSETPNSRGDNFFVSQGVGGSSSQSIVAGDAVFGNGGNDTVTFTDSDYLWWSGHQEGDVLAASGYTIGGDISNLVLQMGAPTARNGSGNKYSSGNDHSGWFEELGSNFVIGNEFNNILNGGGVGGDDNVGGVDTLTGGQGKDLFVVSGYTGASNTKWDINFDRLSDRTRFWDINESTYTDADYVIINDFTSADFLSLASDATWIGRAPTSFEEDNLRPDPNNPLKGISSSEFGIYREGEYDQFKDNTGKKLPDLVAVIKTSGGFGLDIATLVQVAPSGSALGPFLPDGTANYVNSDVAAAGHLGWGAFFDMSKAAFNDGRDFSTGPNSVLMNEGTFQSNIQAPSTASLSSLMGQIA